MVVLMYHDVYAHEKNESGFQNETALGYKVNSSEFERQINKICANNSPDAYALSFDDGGTSFSELILPILDKYHVKGHFFIATNYIGTVGFLTEDQIREIRSHGHFIGAHTASHCSNLSQMKDEDIKREWEISINRLENVLGEKITEVSIPCGNYDKRTLDVLSCIDNISKVYTSDPTTKEKYVKNLCVIGRFGIKENMSSDVACKIVSSRSFRSKIVIRKTFLNILKLVFGKYYYKVRTIIQKKQNIV